MSDAHYIEFGVYLNEDLGVTRIEINYNTTDLPSDSVLVKRVCFTLLKSLVLNNQDVILQDLLNELNIKTDNDACEPS